MAPGLSSNEHISIMYKTNDTFSSCLLKGGLATLRERHSTPALLKAGSQSGEAGFQCKCPERSTNA